MSNHARSRRMLRLHSRQPQTRNALIGVTNNLRKRLEQHRSGHRSEFVKKYGVHRLVHMEVFASPQDAIAREKQLKEWRRDWKIRLVEEHNLDWNDLSDLI